jgi:WS/DGAT/MGAT family acyltransferase
MPNKLPKRLSYQDAAFTTFERESMPLNVGSVGIYEGTISYPGYLAHVDRRIDQIPRYRQRLVPAPYGLVHAEWVDDPHFDITRHIRNVTLDPPGDHQQLARRAAAFFAEPLSREAPLWETLLVHGVEGHRTAHIAKVHHCLVDGVAGIGLLSALLDLEPKPPAQRRRPAHAHAAPLPDRRQMLEDAIFDALADQVRANGEIALALADPLGTARTLQGIARAFATAGRYFIAPAPATPWNHRLTSPTRLAWQSLSFTEVHDVSKALGGKINDVVLTALAGALAHYLADLGERTEGVTLRAACPVNVRSEAQAETLGNRVSFLLVGLPLDVHDPVERFRRIHAESSAAKDAGQPEGVESLMQILGRLPAPAHALLGRTLSLPNTLSNLICTNVPGPLVPLYCMGHRMVEHYPWVPLGWRMGLAVALMSYDTAIWFGFTADQETPGDIDALARHLSDSFRELRDAAGVRAAAAATSDEPPEHLALEKAPRSVVATPEGAPVR